MPDSDVLEGGTALVSRRSKAVAIVTAILIATAAAPALATPIAEKRAQAQTVKRQIDALDVKVERAAEEYNEAEGQYSAVTGKVNRTQAKLKKLRKRIGKLRRRLDTRADHMYRNGATGILDVLLGANSFEEFSTTWDVLKDLNEDDAGTVRSLRKSRTLAAHLERSLLKDQRKARAARDKMASRKASIDSSLAKRKSMLSGIEAEIDRIEDAERRAAAARAAQASRRTWSFPSRGDLGGNPTRQPRSEVVAIAKRYIGYPYQWAASGPNSFDCSGFTMFVYRQVGVSLPHSSSAQYNVGEHVSRQHLAPGDLVFFYSPIHHVGIYVGGGSFIHAPGTGKRVRIDSLSGYGGNYTGATRP